MQSVTQQLADFAAGTKYEDLPSPVVHEAKRVLLDSLGCAVAGMSMDKGKLPVELARRLGGPAESSILGTNSMVSCANASFANGELINALDFDAILPPAIHVTPSILPPALALAERQHASGKELLLAIVLGHEITSRVASGLSRGRDYIKEGPERGKVIWPAVHGYSANAFGCAASAGKMLNLDTGKMANAMGIAGYNAPMQAEAQWQHSGSNSLMKYGSAGWMAQAGITAALLADIGYTGDVTVLDGDHSFWRFAGSQSWQPQHVIKNLGCNWYILNMRYKIYPCCGIFDGALDCFNALMEENRLTPDEIEHVEVLTAPLSDMPLWQNRQLDTEIQAQFSIAYCLAAAAHRLPLGVEWQESGIRQTSRIKEFMEKVREGTHPKYGSAAMDTGTAQMASTVINARGRTYTRETTYARGQALPKEARLSDDYLTEKFQHNVRSILSEDGASEVARCLWELEKLDDVALLMKILAG